MLDKLKAFVTEHPLEALDVGATTGAVLTYVILKFVLKKVKRGGRVVHIPLRKIGTKRETLSLKRSERFIFLSGR